MAPLAYACLGIFGVILLGELVVIACTLWRRRRR